MPKQTTLTKEEKIAKIYEVISDKTLNFGCMMRSYYNGKTARLSYAKSVKYLILLDDYGSEEDLLDSREIIGHPVMIGDVLDWILTQNVDGKIKYGYWAIREKKKKPIEEQSEQCIDFIYSIVCDHDTQR